MRISVSPSLSGGISEELGEALDVAEVEARGVGAEVAEFHVGLVLGEQVGQEDHSPLI